MRKLFSVCVLMLACVQSYAQSDVSTARWMQQPVNIDGINSEWGSLNFYDDETQLNFAIGNDSNHIYLCFESTDEMGQMKLMRGGMKIILSEKGKAKHEVSIAYPIIPAADKNSKPNNFGDSSHETHDRESFRQNFLVTHSTMQVDGFANNNGIVPIKNDDVQVAINWDDANNLFYEVAIAKDAFYGKDFSAKDALADITLNVEINGLPKDALSDAGKNGNRYHTGNQPPGGSMHGGGGMHRGGGGFNNASEKMDQANASMANSANTASLSSKTSFKQKFVLNTNSTAN